MDVVNVRTFVTILGAALNALASVCRTGGCQRTVGAAKTPVSAESTTETARTSASRP